MLRDKSLIRLTPLAVAVLLVVTGTVLAQTDTGKLPGTVKDQNGAISSGTNLTVTNTRIGEERSPKASDDAKSRDASLDDRMRALEEELRQQKQMLTEMRE